MEKRESEEDGIRDIRQAKAELVCLSHETAVILGNSLLLSRPQCLVPSSVLSRRSSGYFLRYFQSCPSDSRS